MVPTFFGNANAAHVGLPGSTGSGDSPLEDAGAGEGGGDPKSESASSSPELSLRWSLIKALMCVVVKREEAYGRI